MNAREQEARSRLDRYSSFLKADRENSSIAAEVADIHFQLGEFAQARAVLESALAIHLTDTNLTVRLASVAMASNQPQEAVDLLEAVMGRGVDTPIVRYNLAYAFMYVGHFADAKALLLPCVNAPEVPEAPLLLARTLHHLEEMEDAINFAKQHIAAYPGHANALGTLALLYLDSDQNEAAKESAGKAIEVDSDNLEARIALGSLALEVQDDEEAKLHFERAITRNPRSGRAWSGMGLASMLDLDVASALAHFQRAVEHMPDHIGTWHSLAWCQILQNDLNGAHASLDKAMALDRNFGETHGGLAVVAVLQGRLQDAPDMIRRSLKLNPHSFAGRFAQSLMTNATDPAKAQEMIRAILSSASSPDGQPLADALRRVASKKLGKQ